MENRYKKYYQLHKEELKQRAKEYRLLNKIVIADKKNKNYLRCRKNILKQKKEYLENNREEINERRRKNYPKYKQKRALGNKLWREKNRDYYNKYSSRYYHERVKKDPQYKMTICLRTRLKNILRNKGYRKNNKTMEYVGCSKKELKKYIKSLFCDDMSWNNYGKWHIDHIYPLSRIDLSKEENIYKVMNYKNLQPLWARDNIIKSNKI